MSTIEQKYNEFMNTQGDVLSRLNCIGYDIPYAPVSISTLEEFRMVVTDDSYVKREIMSKSLKKCYKSHISRGDLSQLLKNGDGGFTEYEVTEAMKILPVKDDGISVDELVEFLYKQSL